MQVNYTRELRWISRCYHGINQILCFRGERVLLVLSFVEIYGMFDLRKKVERKERKYI